MKLDDIFLRLPPPTALLLVSALLDHAQGHALPRQTSTVDYRTLDVVPWPPLPTSPPINLADFHELQRRQGTNTVCGFIGGNPELPATCSAGSHCVLDSEHGAVGCCPNGQDTCTTGVFTGCVDFNSGAQTEVNPYVFTCQGSDVCYKNVFQGGFFQFGCGTASNLATTVAASASGLTSALDLTSLKVPFTGSASSLATPTSINPTTGTRSFTRASQSSQSSESTESSKTSGSTSASTTASSTHATSSSRISSTASSSSVSTTTTSSSTQTTSSPTRSQTASSTIEPPRTIGTSPAEVSPSAAPHNSDHTGAIIGGSISGVALLIGLIALGIYLWRRRRGNRRDGPGPTANTEYISPMSGGQGFAPLHYSQEQYETGLPPPHGTTTAITSGSHTQNFPANGFGFPYPGSYQNSYGGGGGGYAPAAGAAAGAGYTASSRDQHREPDQVPLTQGGSHEIEDFSRGYHEALGRIGEEDEDELSGSSSGNLNGNGLNHSGDLGEPASGGGVRPLWQQNRRQSRNLMWM